MPPWTKFTASPCQGKSWTSKRSIRHQPSTS
jgi:hypothetical protein